MLVTHRTPIQDGLMTDHWIPTTLHMRQVLTRLDPLSVTYNTLYYWARNYPVQRAGCLSQMPGSWERRGALKDSGGWSMRSLSSCSSLAFLPTLQVCVLSCICCTARFGEGQQSRMERVCPICQSESNVLKNILLLCDPENH